MVASVRRPPAMSGCDRDWYCAWRRYLSTASAGQGRWASVARPYVGGTGAGGGKSNGGSR